MEEQGGSESQLLQSELEDELKWVRVKVRTKGVYNVWRSLQRKRRGRTAGPPIAVAGAGTGTGTGGSSSGNSRNGGDGDDKLDTATLLQELSSAHS